MPSFDRDLVSSRLEEFRRNLLDTSLRNRLINFRSESKSGKSLDKVIVVRGEDPSEIIRILVTDGKQMSFVGRADPRAATEALALDEIESTDPNEPVDPTDLKLNTTETANSLHRKLTKIHRDAKVSLEEQGVNILFLALGSLVWYEDQKPTEERRAPLVLLPVTLERLASGSFRIRWDGGDPIGNLSIAAKVQNEYGFRLPPIPEELDFREYLNAIRSVIRTRPSWHVEEDAANLAFFSYAKFLMYADLATESWPQDRRPGDHATLGELLDSGFEDPDHSVSEHQLLDDVRSPQTVCEVYDADGSQTLAILEATTGRSMIIEGPPGTGKSQTITNLIAEYIDAGKKVLFVAEKAAALDVVFRRLKEANLGDACLELHSNKTNKRAFYTELKRTVSIAAPKTASAQADLERLGDLRNKLNTYCEAVNQPLQRRQISPRFAMGKLIELGKEPSPAGRHDFRKMETWSQQDFENRKIMVERLRNHVARMGSPREHPYFGCTLLQVLPQDKLDIAQMLATAEEAVEALATSATALAERLAVEIPVLPSDVEKLGDWARFVANAPSVQGVKVASPNWPILEPQIRSLIESGQRLEEISKQLGQSCLPFVAQDVSRLDKMLQFDGFFSGPIERKQPGKALLERFGVSIASVLAVLAEGTAAAVAVGMAPPLALSEMEPIAAVSKRMATAPDLQQVHIAETLWSESANVIREALSAVRTAQKLRDRYSSILNSHAWEANVADDIEILEKHGASVFKFLNGSYRATMARTKGLFKEPKVNASTRLQALKAVEDVRQTERTISIHRGRCSSLFGTRWQGTSSDIETLESIASWLIEAHEAVRAGKLPISALQALERGALPSALGERADSLRTNLAQTVKGLQDFLALGASEGYQPINERSPLESLWEWILDSVRPNLPDLKKLSDSSDLIRPEHCRILLNLVLEAQSLEPIIKSAKPLELGPLWQGLGSDWPALDTVLRWLVQFHADVDRGTLPKGLMQFFSEERPKDGLKEAVTLAQSDRKRAQEAVEKVLQKAALHDNPASFTEDAIAIQRQKIKNWRSRLEDLQPLIVYNFLCAQATQIGLTESVELSQEWDEAAVHLTSAFERSWYTGVIREAMSEREPIRHFDRVEHEQVAREFRDLDSTLLLYNRAKVALAHWRGVPRDAAGGAMGWLQTQFELKKSHRAIRMAMSKAGDAILAIKPVFLMSPISVAMYLPSDGPRFDVVIFDEASQVKPEDSFGCILRAQQTIVVGDTKQMPPTSFFDKLTGDSSEDDDEETSDQEIGSMKELESVLAMMSAKVPINSPRRRWLRWHYRSRHDALIQTSNRLFYDDKLVVFPSPFRAGAGSGLVFRHDSTTVYDRGASRKNQLEAAAVARATLRHVTESPAQTLGIAAFSKAQQEAIQDELDILRKSEPAFAEFDNRHPFEPLIVKNLENIQGDERDVIYISVGYGRDQGGFIPASFGPLNRDGGERRLNVLITRARIRCEIFTNLRSGDVRFGEARSAGVSALRTFLAFAETGTLDVPAQTGHEPQSPFEEAVLTRLRNRGYIVDPQVGSCGFFIDMAVRHPDRPEQYVLGIECDGAMYHRARSARDRDKLRQNVLEDRGWRIHRIWSTDWFNHEEREFSRLLESVEAAIANPHFLLPTSKYERAETPFQELERETELVEETNQIVYQQCDLTIKLDRDLHDVPASSMGLWVAQIAEVEAPIHSDEIMRRIREAAGIARSGNRIQTAVSNGIVWAAKRSLVETRGEFVFLPNQTIVPVRWRGGFSSKKLEFVSDEEIQSALLAVVTSSFGIQEAEAIPLSARMLGFDRTTVQMTDRISSCVSQLIENNKLERQADVLRVTSTTAD